MTGKLFTGTLNKNQNKQNKKNILRCQGDIDVTLSYEELNSLVIYLCNVYNSKEFHSSYDELNPLLLHTLHSSNTKEFNSSYDQVIPA